MRFIRPREVLEMIGVSRSTLKRLVQSGAFPPPVRITTRNNVFVLEAVEEWMEARTMGRAWEPLAQPASMIRLAQLAVPRAASGTRG